MTKRCACKGIYEVFAETRVRTLPLEVQALWLRIVELMQRDGVAVLRFGGVPLGLDDLARLVGFKNTETGNPFENQIEVLCARGLLAREADGAVGCALLQEQRSRAEINRENGRKGGRPPGSKNKVAGQRDMTFPQVVGGTDMAPEHETGKPSVNSVSSNNTNNNKVIDESVFRDTGEKVLALVGIDPAKSRMDYGQVRQWLADGASPELILATVRAVMERTSNTVYSLKFFNNSIAEAMARQPVARPDWERAYFRAVAVWDGLGRFGEQPRLADFKPREVA